MPEIFHYIEWVEPGEAQLPGLVMSIPQSDDSIAAIHSDAGDVLPVILDHVFPPDVQAFLDDQFNAAEKGRKRVDVIREMESEFAAQGYDLLKDRKKDLVRRFLHMRDSDFNPKRPTILNRADGKHLSRTIRCTSLDTRLLIEYSLKWGMAEYMKQNTQDFRLN